MNNVITAPDLKDSGPQAVICGVREKAQAYFDAHGYPHPKLEEWKYTNVRKIVAPDYLRPEKEQTGPDRREFETHPLTGLDAWYLVLVNGWVNESLSVLPEPSRGIRIGSMNDESFQAELARHLGSVAEIGSGFAASNTAAFTDGAFVLLEEGAQLDKPLVIYHLALTGEQPLMSQPRHMILAGKGSGLKVVEIFAGASAAPSLTNVVTEIKAAANSVVDYTKLQLETGENYHIGLTEVEQHENASIDTHIISLNGAFIRNNLHFHLRDRYCRTIMNGLYLPGCGQFLDNHTRVNHSSPECYSDQLYKGIINDQATAVFNGKIFVEKDAQKTNAYQRNINILLSDEATINTKPQLEIFADDVRCTHGATSGHLDEEAIFYLRSRGLSEADARRLLLHAYASEVIEKLLVEELKEPLMEMAAQKFSYPEAL